MRQAQAAAAGVCRRTPSKREALLGQQALASFLRAWRRPLSGLRRNRCPGQRPQSLLGRLVAAPTGLGARLGLTLVAAAGLRAWLGLTLPATAAARETAALLAGLLLGLATALLTGLLLLAAALLAWLSLLTAMFARVMTHRSS